MSEVPSSEVPSSEVPSSEVTVLLVEEYGYRTWVWHTGMDSDRLSAWWGSLPTLMPFFFNPLSGGLPGDLVQVEAQYDPAVDGLLFDEALSDAEKTALLAKAVRENPPTYLNAITGEVVSGESSDWWGGHIHMDDDSWLETPSGVRLHHAGYSEE